MPASPGMDAKRSGEAPEEDGLPAPGLEIALRSLEMVGLDDPADAALEYPAAPPLADLVADAVADDGPGHGGQEHRSEAGLMLGGEHTTEEHGDLAREEEADEGRRLQGREQEDHR